MHGRRGFLKMLGIGAAVAPIAIVAAPRIVETVASESAIKAAAMDKLVNPPLLASMWNEPTYFLPGGLTYVEAEGVHIGTLYTAQEGV